MRTQDLVEDLPRPRGVRLGEDFDGRPDNLGAEHDVEPGGLEFAEDVAERPAGVLLPFDFAQGGPFDFAQGGPAPFDRLTAPLAGTPGRDPPDHDEHHHATESRRSLGEGGPGHGIAPVRFSRAITTRWPSMR